MKKIITISTVFVSLLIPTTAFATAPTLIGPVNKKLVSHWEYDYDRSESYAVADVRFSFKAKPDLSGEYSEEEMVEIELATGPKLDSDGFFVNPLEVSENGDPFITDFNEVRSGRYITSSIWSIEPGKYYWHAIYTSGCSGMSDYAEDGGLEDPPTEEAPCINEISRTGKFLVKKPRKPNPDFDY